MGTAIQPPVQPGEVVAGKYRVERVLGRGGMGVVLAATHLQLGDQVALKFLGGALASSPESMQRFLAEARATFKLRSEHAVRMLDLGALPSGEVFIVMELLEGQDLRQTLAARGPLSAADAARYVIDACSALEEAHALGIVHRDLKPSNLFLAKRAHGAPIVKVLDFGVSKTHGDESALGPVSRPDVPIGTPKYMAPEQWKLPSVVDARTDVYALGVVLYELLTGHVPLHELDLEARRARLLAGAIPSPRALRPTLSETICKVTLRCMQAVPDGRYPSAKHLAAALGDAIPAAAPRPPKAALGTTAVTAVVNKEDVARDAALAFADVTEKQAVAPLFDALAEVTRTEFVAARAPTPQPPVVHPQPPSTVRGTPRAAPAPAAPAPRQETLERPAVTPPRDRMPTPTRIEVVEQHAAPTPQRIPSPRPMASPVAPSAPVHPSAPPGPMRPKMLTPTQNDPRAKTLQSAVAPAWLPAVVASSPAMPAPPAIASPPAMPAMPSSHPAVGAIHAMSSSNPPAPTPSPMPPRAPGSSRVVLALAVLFILVACVSGAVVLVLRFR